MRPNALATEVLTSFRRADRGTRPAELGILGPWATLAGHRWLAALAATLAPPGLVGDGARGLPGPRRDPPRAPADPHPPDARRARAVLSPTIRRWPSAASRRARRPRRSSASWSSSLALARRRRADRRVARSGAAPGGRHRRGPRARLDPGHASSLRDALALRLAAHLPTLAPLAYAAFRLIGRDLRRAPLARRRRPIPLAARGSLQRAPDAVVVVGARVARRRGDRRAGGPASGCGRGLPRGPGAVRAAAGSAGAGWPRSASPRWPSVAVVAPSWSPCGQVVGRTSASVLLRGRAPGPRSGAALLVLVATWILGLATAGGRARVADAPAWTAEVAPAARPVAGSGSITARSGASNPAAGTRGRGLKYGDATVTRPELRASRTLTLRPRSAPVMTPAGRRGHRAPTAPPDGGDRSPNGPDLHRDRRCDRLDLRQPGHQAGHPARRHLLDRSCGSPPRTGRSATCSRAATTPSRRTSRPRS